MNPWLGKAVLLAGAVATAVIRHRFEGPSRAAKVVESRKDAREIVLIALMMVSNFLLPLVYIATSRPWFAGYPLHPAAFAAGAAFMALSVWVFYRSHADLGRNWSISLEIRENHTLVTGGVYRRIRHPMYAAIYAYAIAQALLLANWVVGPASLVAFTLMFASRLGREERMMVEKFGAEYERYRQRTKRLVPGVW